MEEETGTVLTFSMWAAAFAITRGVRLMRLVPGQRSAFVLDDHDGKATAALTEWRTGNPLVLGRSLVEVQRELMTIVRNSSAVEAAQRGK